MAKGNNNSQTQSVEEKMKLVKEAWNVFKGDYDDGRTDYYFRLYKCSQPNEGPQSSAHVNYYKKSVNRYDHVHRSHDFDHEQVRMYQN